MTRKLDGFTLIDGAMKVQTHGFWFGTIVVARDGRQCTHRLDGVFFRTSEEARTHADNMIDLVETVGPNHALRFARDA